VIISILFIIYGANIIINWVLIVLMLYKYRKVRAKFYNIYFVPFIILTSIIPIISTLFFLVGISEATKEYDEKIKNNAEFRRFIKIKDIMK
jgi:hypothetical protein